MNKFESRYFQKFKSRFCTRVLWWLETKDENIGIMVRPKWVDRLKETQSKLEKIYEKRNKI